MSSHKETRERLIRAWAKRLADGVVPSFPKSAALEHSEAIRFLHSELTLLLAEEGCDSAKESAKEEWLKELYADPANKLFGEPLSEIKRLIVQRDSAKESAEGCVEPCDKPADHPIHDPAEGEHPFRESAEAKCPNCLSSRKEERRCQYCATNTRHIPAGGDCVVCQHPWHAESAEPEEWMRQAAKEIVEANADRGRTYDNSPDCLETAEIIRKHAQKGK